MVCWCSERLLWVHVDPPLPRPSSPQIVVVNQNLHAILQKSHHMQKIREMFGSKRRTVRPLADLAEEQVSPNCLCYLCKGRRGGEGGEGEGGGVERGEGRRGGEVEGGGGKPGGRGGGGREKGGRGEGWGEVEGGTVVAISFVVTAALAMCGEGLVHSLSHVSCVLCALSCRCLCFITP